MPRDWTEAYFRKIQKKYGIDQDEFLRMLVDQESKCLGCDRELTLFDSDRSRGPVVDHDHEHERLTGEIKVRGILCTGCNTYLGKLEKDPYRTYSLLAYIGNPQDRYPRLRDEVADRKTRREERRARREGPARSPEERKERDDALTVAAARFRAQPWPGLDKLSGR